MLKNKSLEEKTVNRISRKKGGVVVREDFKDLGGYDQVGRALRRLVAKRKIAKIGYGLYAKTKTSPITGEIILRASLPQLAKEALSRLGVKIGPSRMERDNNAGKSTQVPTGRVIAVKGRVCRKIGYGGARVKFERFAG